MKSQYKEHNTKEKQKFHNTKTRNNSQSTINNTKIRPTKNKQNINMRNPNTYDVGTQTKERMMKDSKIKCHQQLQTPDNRSLNNPNQSSESDTSSPTNSSSWNILVEKIHITIIPLKIITSNQSSISSLTRNSRYNPRKKKKEK